MPGFDVCAQSVVSVPGLTRRHLAHLFAVLGFRRGAEIGVRQAAFSLQLCQTIPHLSLLCVDPWQHYRSNPKQFSQTRHDHNLRIARQRLASYPGAIILRMTSREAVETVEWNALDFVFIDGNHGYADVVHDLSAWVLRVRGGGIISGDDYDAPGVRHALDEFCACHHVTRVWITDDYERGKTRAGQLPRAWFWRKETSS